VPAPTGETSRSRLHPVVARLAVAHFSVDWFSNSLAPLLPVLIPRLGLSLAGAGTLTMVFQLSSSVAQLLFGGLADRGHAKALLVGGAVATVLCLGVLGLSASWGAVVAALVCGGLGVAAFHPAGAMLAHRFSQGRPGYSMAAYVTAGTLGFAAGPMVLALVAQRFGVASTAWLILPGLLAVGAALWRLPAFAPAATRPRGALGFAALRPYARPLTLLYFLVVIRGFVSASVTTFVPVLLARRGASVTLAAAGVASYFAGGGLGGFFGGSLADTIGHRRVILMSMLFPVPFLVAAPIVPPSLTLIALALAGFFLQSTLPVNVSFGQLIAPVSAATVASLLMGFAWGLGGLLVPMTGIVADRVGLETTMIGLGLIPLIGVALAWPLPRQVR
jgi:FSR family fosmidomycin resistance protein-like MFS transporter